MRLARPVLALFALVALAHTTSYGAAVPLDTTHVLPLKDGWEYARLAGPLTREALPGEWEQVGLPHAEALADNAAYRIRFPIPALWSREKVELVVRCPVGIVRAWLNDQELGTRRGAALEARFDASECFRRGRPNTLLLAIETAAWLPRGALEACWLEATPAAAIARLLTTAHPLAGQAIVDARAAVRNRTEKKLEARLELALEPVNAPAADPPVWRRQNDVNLDPGKAAAFHHMLEIDRLKRWRFDAPHRYQLTATLRNRGTGRVLHSLRRQLGARTVAVADGRWIVDGDWVRLAGIAVPARGATLLCTQPGQATAAAAWLASRKQPRLERLLDLCDREGIVVWLHAPAWNPEQPGSRETLDALGALAWHPSVWAWLVAGDTDHFASTLARLRLATPGLPVGRPLPFAPEQAQGYDFVVSRFDSEAVHKDNQEYGRRLDDAVRASGGKSVAFVDRMAPAAPGDRGGILAAIPHRRNETARRWPVGMFFFELPHDTELFRQAEQHFAAGWLKPPRHEGRTDRGALVLKTHFEWGAASPVVARIPSYPLHDYRLCWRAEEGTAPRCNGAATFPVHRPRPVEGGGPDPMRKEVEWRLPKPATVSFEARLANPQGRVIAEHCAGLAATVGKKGRVQLRSVARPPQRRDVLMLDLTKWLNNDGISSKANTKDGNFDLPRLKTGSTFPAERLPSSAAPFAVPAPADITFRFPPKADGKPNNVACNGQRIPVAPGAYATLWLLATADTGDQPAAVRLIHGAKERIATVRLTDWCSAPRFGECEAVVSPERHGWNGQVEKTPCRIWAVAVPLAAEPLTAILLPSNQRVHVFAITLVRQRSE